MTYGVLGTGMVGQALAGKLVALGHDVMMGSRDAQNPKALTWATRAGSRAQVGTFAETAVFGEVLFNCTHGASSVEALRAAGEQHLADKILVDVSKCKSLLWRLGRHGHSASSCRTSRGPVPQHRLGRHGTGLQSRRSGRGNVHRNGLLRQ